MAMSMLRVCSIWRISPSLRLPTLHATSISHGAPSKSRTKLVMRLFVKSLSVQDESNVVKVLAMDLALKVAGMPLSVVLIGVALGQNMEIGVVYNSFNNELFYTRSDQGAYLNGNLINVLPHDTELEDLTISMGFPSKPEWQLHMLEAIGKVAPSARLIRALGTAALHMSYVEAGQIGCFFEHNLKPWDVAAARLIIEEAGGKVTDLKGNYLPLIAGSILASNGGILHNHIVQLVSD